MKKIFLILFSLVSIKAFCQMQVLKSYKKVSMYTTPALPLMISYFGDSFTDNHIFGYPIKIFADNSISYTNYGVGGTKVCDATYAPAPGNSNLIDVYTTELALGYRGGTISFMYGQNDGAVPGLVNASWKAVYKSVIQAFITAGWPRKRIIMMAQPHIILNGTAPALVLIRQYDLEIAQELGIQFYNVYQRFLDTGANDTFFDGTAHPNDAGQALIASGYETFLLR